MIRTVSLICASRIIRDATDNRISAIDMFDDTVIQGFPIVFPRTSILWLLERSQEDSAQTQGTLSVSLNNAVLQDIPVNINFQDKMRTRAIVLIGGLVLQNPGRLAFGVRREGVEGYEAEYWLNVGAGPAQVGAQAGGGIVV